MIRLYCFPGAADNYMLPVQVCSIVFMIIDSTKQPHSACSLLSQ